MNINIRNETIADYDIVERITREAFWNLYRPGCNEHFIIHKMRAHRDFIPELTFVIELDNEIVGSIFYSHSKVVDEEGNEYKTITFGPVSISPHLHRKGFGFPTDVQCTPLHQYQARFCGCHKRSDVGVAPYTDIWQGISQCWTRSGIGEKV